ncbi:hypothetical protein B0J12DRAFT_674981 [Macrophomina phaseolina]|uniref:Secreted protein n=1 Tax=Macrophomina phaseolina TaxID=35725 RepID=A0ABQ8G0Z8_9PEZI|nr:hypothetical protein B0J12DRAFT_674981 [Macrophomina phaseolina]
MLLALCLSPPPAVHAHWLSPALHLIAPTLSDTLSPGTCHSAATPSLSARSRSIGPLADRCHLCSMSPPAARRPPCCVCFMRPPMVRM